MKTEVSSLELRYLVKEFQELIDSKVDKVYMPEERDVILSLHIPNKGKRLLRILPNMIYLASIKPENPLNPFGFCAYLRKKLTNARIRSIRQHEFERILIIELDSKEGSYIMIIELFSKGNVVLCDSNLKILSPLEIQHWKGREIKPKETYVFPEARRDPFKLDEKGFSDIIIKSDKENISKKIALELGLGGVFAEEVCLMASIDPKAKTGDPKRLYRSLMQLISKDLSPQLVYDCDRLKDIIPFDLLLYKSDKKVPKDSLNSAVDSVLSSLIVQKKADRSDSKFKKEIERLERMISEQKATIDRLSKDSEEYQMKGELIYENYQLISGIHSELRKAMEKYSMQEIKAKLKGHKIIKDVNEKDKMITVEIE